MRSMLSRFGYSLDQQTRIWSRPGYTGIAYSDGDEVEQRIAATIEQASDVSVLSTELRQHCTDWPSLYHLSSARANILRPFAADIIGDVLEVGAGCGAITRYLGECGANVLALEGSLRRAGIARSRNRDLPNVTVISDSLDQFRCDQQFDIVTLIGVLEYANLFTLGESPAVSMLERVRALLKPSGKLIIAIENQLGLKYFAGAPEDHVGQAMYGIEGRYLGDQPNTYGRKTLARMLSQAGFAYSSFMAPFPDYKSPISIVTERGFSDEGFDAAALAWQSVRRDPQLPPMLAFSPELVWPALAQNGIALDLANSFLVVAGGDTAQQLDLQILAWHFSTERSKEFCKETLFVRADGGPIEVQYYLLAPNLTKCSEGRVLAFLVPERAEYTHGRPLSQELVGIVTRDGWRIEQVGAFLRRYLHILGSVLPFRDTVREINSAHTALPGEFFDCLPQNILIRGDGLWQVIDKEWTLNDDIPAGRMVFRALLALMAVVTRFGETASDFVATPLGFIDAAFKSIGFSVTESEIESYANVEMAVHSEVVQRALSSDQLIMWLRTAPLPHLNLSQAVAERDGQITCLNRAVSERDGQIARLSQEVSALRGSMSWKVTAPIRFAGQQVKRIGRLVGLLPGIC